MSNENENDLAQRFLMLLRDVDPESNVEDSIAREFASRLALYSREWYEDGDSLHESEEQLLQWLQSVTRDGGGSGEGPGVDGTGHYLFDVVSNSLSQRRAEKTHTIDELTGLLNLHGIKRAFQFANDKSHTDSTEHMLLLAGFDSYQSIREAGGNQATDAFHKHIASLIRDSVRAVDNIARLNGDEFVLFLECCPLEHACRVAEQIIARTDGYSFTWNDLVFDSHASIGLTATEHGKSSFDDYIRESDKALAIARNADDLRIHIYHANDARLPQRSTRLYWEERIRNALERDEFRLLGQLIEKTWEVHDDLVRFEVQFILEEEDGSCISSNELKIEADRCDSGSEVDYWIIGNTVKWLSEQPHITHSLDFAAFNIGRSTLEKPGFCDFILSILDKHQLSGRFLCFEISYADAMTDIVRTAALIRSLKQVGCTFAISSYGNDGPSSESLRQLNADFLKIDCMFVMDMLSEHRDLALVLGSNDIARNLGMKTIAECVESAKSRSVLQSIGVDYVQGKAVGIPDRSRIFAARCLSRQQAEAIR